MDEQVPQQPVAPSPSPIYQESQEKNAKWLWLLIILIVIGALVFAFVKGIGPFGRFRSNLTQTSPTPEASPAELFTSPSPEATPGSDLDKSEPKIRILNGSGKAGAATTAKDLVEGKGYKVTSVGNATSYDFQETVLRFKSAFKKFEELLTNDLSGSYSVKTDEEELEATDSADIEIVVGSK